MFAVTDPYAHTGWKFFFMFVGPLLSIVVVCFAAWSSVRFARRRLGRRAFASVLIGAISVAIWWLAIPVARRWTGWVDIDHDGMLDGFVAGRYDSVDMYGGHWGALVMGFASAGALALVALRWNGTRIDEVISDLDAGHF